MNERFLIDKEKLNEICKFYGLKFTKFADKIGINRNELYALNSFNQGEFSRNTLTAICKGCPEISPYWLITGEGSMLGGHLTQSNVNGDNLNNSQKSTIPDGVIKVLTDTNASQQQTIAQLVSMLNNK